MAKNLVGVVPVNEDEFYEFADEAAVEATRAKFVKPVVRNVAWAKKNRVDDESIMAVFEGESQDLIMSLSFQERLNYIHRQQFRLYREAMKAA